MAWSDFITQPIGDLLGGITGANKGASAAQGAANLQYQISKEALDAQNKIADRNLSFQRDVFDYQKQARREATEMAEPSAAQLAVQAKSIDLFTSSIARYQDLLERDMKLMDSIDPAIKSAGEQLFALSNGKAASILDPVQKQIDLQREKLKSTLAERLGPGYETSTAGIEAMQRFETNAQMTIANTQQGAMNTLSNVLGTTMGSRSNLLATEGNALTTAGNIGNMAFNQAQGLVGQKVNAYLGAPVNVVPQQTMPDYSTLINAAGQTGIGSMYKSQQQGQLINTGIQAGAMYAALA